MSRAPSSPDDRGMVAPALPAGGRSVCSADAGEPNAPALDAMVPAADGRAPSVRDGAEADALAVGPEKHAVPLDPLHPRALCSESSFDCLAQGYCAMLSRERTGSAHTVRAARTDLDAYGRWCVREGRDVTSLTHRDIRSYLAFLDQARYARATIARALSTIRGFHRWLFDEGHAQSDAASFMQGPRASRHLPAVMRPAQAALLLDAHRVDPLPVAPTREEAIALRDWAILEFLYASGARVGEVSSLRTDALDLPHGQAKVMGKGSKERIVPLHDLCLDALMSYRRLGRPVLVAGRDEPWLFLSSRGGRMSTDALRKMFKKALARAGLPGHFSPHALRHSFATDVLAGGADLRSVQELLGHASLSTTQVYTHLTPEGLRSVHRQAHPRA
ncbi:tyrosine recombinase XerC [Berryella wangjianweii]|uniref:tyrosine recombinase XerC n=1 Tax=Berryella wangjianweii TaxID=2734634 RepID=UPI0021BD0194|nr:tyrosine recombinase XerC [Berryella wangjianweii]